MNEHTMTLHAMSCAEFEARLNELLDERAPLDLDDVLREHHNTCPDCRELFTAFGEVVHAVQFRPPPEPGGRFNERIIAAVLAQHRADAAQPAGTHRRAFGLHREWCWRAGLVASLAILVALAWKLGAPGTNRPAAPNEEIVIRSEEAPPHGQTLSALARDAASRHLGGLAQGTLEDLSDVLTLVPDVDPSPAAAWWPGDEVAANTQPAKVATHLAQTFQPLATSTKKTLDYLFGSPRDDKGDL